MNIEGPTDKVQSASLYDTQLQYLGYHTGYNTNISVHTARREALIEACGEHLTMSFVIVMFWLTCAETMAIRLLQE